jgi:hypothetical protein
VLEKTLALLDIQLRDSQVALTCEFAPELPQVYADPDLVQQVFLNLCLNAIQAMPQGGELNIATGMRRTRARRPLVDVSFHDSGVGFPEFVGKSRPVQHHPLDGHGAGAADLGADRARGGGDDHRQEQRGRRGDPAGLDPGAGRAPGQGRGVAVKLSVLVVDDELLIRKSLAKVLRARGYAVELASTGAE